jgi:small neutral amino acid transporter SnatA (MarC family)
MIFFLLFGTLIMRLFGAPLSMVRIVGGIILMKIGFIDYSGRRRRLAPILRSCR